MSIQGSGDGLSPLYRIHAIDADHGEDRQRKRERQARYLGRRWREEEDDLSLGLPTKEKRDSKGPTNIYADRNLLSQAEELLRSFPTLEDKISQLCFYGIEAIWDLERQALIEELILSHSIGGFIFSNGDFRRIGFLIERFQSLSTLPLIMGSDLLQGLSFYFQGQCPVGEVAQMSEAHLCDLGKAVVFQNRKLGIQLQLTESQLASKQESILLTRERIRALSNGIREAHGIVGKERRHEPKVNVAHPLSLAPISMEPAQELVSLRTLYFRRLFASMSDEELERELELFFHQSFDILLLPLELTRVVSIIVNLVEREVVGENEINRRLMKVLLLKRNAFPAAFRKSI